ncbi:MAG: TlpA family protein disulfide reductase, partial [Duncaniella sp.]|nr:TlpA family protein disulfide reductase [Duncaniella sp.]
FMANRPRKLPASVEAKTIGAFDIKLFAPDGKEQSLLDITAGGKVVLLSFTSYAAEWSPAFNVELNRLYSKYKDRGFEIYQVSTDTNDYIWKQAARNLPWVTVINNLATGGENLRNYNVTVVPTTFVINRQGELVERVLSVEDLDRAVSAHL